MIGGALFTDNFLETVSVKEPDIEKIKQLVIEAYNKENSSNVDLSRGLTQEDEYNLMLWLNQIHMDHPHSYLLSHRKVSVWLPLFSTTLSDKIGSLAQYNCPFCTSDTSFPIIHIPIRIAAISKQAVAKKPKVREAFEKAIRSRLSYYQNKFQRGEKLCVFVVFVLSKDNRDKDLDNMSKALLDALKTVLLGDDMDINHLSLLKTKHDGDEDFITVNIRKSEVNVHHDVLIKSFHHGWAGAEFLDLKQFM